MSKQPIKSPSQGGTAENVNEWIYGFRCCIDVTCVLKLFKYVKFY